MDYVRKDTIFDGRDNNWMDFAMRQAEFYSNIEQHIMNTEIDIADIDDSISDLMNEIEMADCDVTQGYELFIRLKELSLERRNLTKQLKCLHILTANLDVKMITEEYESRLAALKAYLYGSSAQDNL